MQLPPSFPQAASGALLRGYLKPAGLIRHVALRPSGPRHNDCTERCDDLVSLPLRVVTLGTVFSWSAWIASGEAALYLLRCQTSRRVYATRTTPAEACGSAFVAAELSNLLRIGPRRLRRRPCTPLCSAWGPRSHPLADIAVRKAAPRIGAPSTADSGPVPNIPPTVPTPPCTTTHPESAPPFRDVACVAPASGVHLRKSTTLATLLMLQPAKLFLALDGANAEHDF